MLVAWATLVSILLALAIKQVSEALIYGSVFKSVRRFIKQNERQGIFGFGVLNDIFSCKLCMTMQVSLWVVALPLFIGGNYFNVLFEAVGERASWATVEVFFLLGVFLYAMATSSIALALWNFFDYPAKRYEDLVERMREANRTIEDLRANTLQSDTPAIKTELLSFSDFRKFMMEVNAKCSRHGCGYARRDCRSEAIAGWLKEWARDRPDRRRKLPDIRDTLNDLLPDYFRQYSDSDRDIEDEDAFRDLYRSVVAAVTA